MSLSMFALTAWYSSTIADLDNGVTSSTIVDNEGLVKLVDILSSGFSDIGGAL